MLAKLFGVFFRIFRTIFKTNRLGLTITSRDLGIIRLVVGLASSQNGRAPGTSRRLLARGYAPSTRIQDWLILKSHCSGSTD